MGRGPCLPQLRSSPRDPLTNVTHFPLARPQDPGERSPGGGGWNKSGGSDPELCSLRAPEYQGPRAVRPRRVGAVGSGGTQEAQPLSGHFAHLPTPS